MDPLTEPRRSMGNEVLNRQLGGLYGRWNLGDTGRAEVAPSCPRCASPNTKFCYYNNYSLSQPRYFCKSCRRYWTKGGSLRNVPVGGGCRKSRRSRAARASKGEASPLSPLNSNSNSSGSEDLNERDRISVNDLDAPEIDLAMVFAKFLNPDSCPEPELHPLNYIDQESPIAAASTDPLYAMMPDYVFDPMMHLPQEIAVEKQPVSEAGEFMIGSESSALGLMPVDLSAEGDVNRPMPGDGLWLDAEPSLPNYTWQQPETSPSDDSWKIDSSADSWNSTFDHSGFEILS